MSNCNLHNISKNPLISLYWLLFISRHTFYIVHSKQFLPLITCQLSSRISFSQSSPSPILYYCAVAAEKKHDHIATVGCYGTLTANFMRQLGCKENLIFFLHQSASLEGMTFSKFTPNRSSISDNMKVTPPLQEALHGNYQRALLRTSWCLGYSPRSCNERQYEP